MTTHGDRRALVVGSALLFFGAAWLLHSVGLLRGFFGHLFPAAIFASLAAYFYFGFEARRRPIQLVLAGLFSSLAAIVLLETLHFRSEALVPTILFAGPAAAFLRLYQIEGRRGWLGAAWVAAVISAASLVGSIHGRTSALAGTVVLWGMAAAFLYSFLRGGKDTPLVIGGVLTALGFIPAAEALRLPDAVGVGLVFLTLSGTFASLWLVGTPGHTAWAIYPAGGFAVAAAFSFLSGPMLSFVFPIALITAGLWLIFGAKKNGAVGENGGGTAG